MMGDIDMTPIQIPKAEYERLKYIEERYRKLFYLLYDPIIIIDANNKHLRPVKRTSKQDVYHTLLKAQEILEVPRHFPWNDKYKKYTEGWWGDESTN